ncbi:hypothetical protein [Catenibacterium sp.]
MSDLVSELHIVGDDNNIFDTDMEYITPFISVRMPGRISSLSS